MIIRENMNERLSYPKRRRTELPGMFWYMRQWKAVVAPPCRLPPDIVANSIGLGGTPTDAAEGCC